MVGNSSTSACSISTRHEGGTVVITVTGTIDMVTVGQLEAAIEMAMAGAPARVVIDLLGVQFLASVGIGALVAVHHHPTVRLAVVAAGPATARPLQLVGVADVIDICPTLDDALNVVLAQR
ncbi:STAS domain-containing protein [Arthrobacter sp. SLBN-53]|uniref:STAS domain-containing protein n=1 Tax=Arthrobacter sp. SLBN-53 TaxID=2768412 RepID=UPI001C208577|nr:STAS domain-containing protein [Arthrobacter sp. SLBN-53]